MGKKITKEQEEEILLNLLGQAGENGLTRDEIGKKDPKLLKYAEPSLNNKKLIIYTLENRVDESTGKKGKIYVCRAVNNNVA